MRVAIFLLMMSFPVVNFGQSISAQDVIDRSITYHDPGGRLMKKKLQMHFVETRPGGDDRTSSVIINAHKEYFHLSNQRDGKSVQQIIDRGNTQILVDGSDQYSKEIAKEFRLSNKRVAMLKNYYTYLWLMPNKLNDPGSIIDPKVDKVDFFGKELLQIRISYAPEVGNDVWYFYFHPKTYALSGYRFYHDETKNDGEYILLEGETSARDVRLRSRRTWYTHKEDKLLGADILESLTIK